MGNIQVCEEEVIHAEHLSDTCDVGKLHLKASGQVCFIKNCNTPEMVPVLRAAGGRRLAYRRM